MMAKNWKPTSGYLWMHMFVGRTDVEAETPVLWPPDAKSWCTGKDPDAGKDCGQEEKGTTEDEMVGRHHRLDGHGFRWTPEVGDGQGGLACCGSWGRKESDTTEWLNWNKMGYVCTMQNSSGIKGTNNWYTTWMDLKSTTLTDKSLTRNTTDCLVPFTQNQRRGETTATEWEEVAVKDWGW